MQFTDLELLIVLFGNGGHIPSEKRMSLMYQVLVHLGVDPSSMQYLVQYTRLMGSQALKNAPTTMNSAQKQYLIAYLVVLNSIDGDDTTNLTLRLLSKLFNMPIMDLSKAWIILNSDSIRFDDDF